LRGGEERGARRNEQGYKQRTKQRRKNHEHKKLNRARPRGGPKGRQASFSESPANRKKVIQPSRRERKKGGKQTLREATERPRLKGGKPSREKKGTLARRKSIKSYGRTSINKKGYRSSAEGKRIGGGSGQKKKPGQSINRDASAGRNKGAEVSLLPWTVGNPVRRKVTLATVWEKHGTAINPGGEREGTTAGRK